MKGLRERQPGSFEYAFYDKHKKPKRKYITFKADSYEDALIYVATKLKAYKNGSYDPWLKIVDDIEQALERYLKESTHIRVTTRKTKSNQLNLFIKYLPYKSFKLIDAEIIGGFIVRMNTEASRAFRLACVASFWNWCIKKGYTKNDPVTEFKQNTRIRINKNKKTRNALTVSQFIQILGEAQSDKEDYHAIIFDLAAMTGLRRNELIYLNQRDVTLAERTGSIHVREWINPKTGEQFQPKTGERIVPLVPRAVAMLKGLVDKSDDPFHPVLTNHGERLKPNRVSQKFSEFKRACGFGKSITFHSTRHSYLTWIMALRVDPYQVLRIAGHGDLTTQQRYIHFVEQMLSGGAAKIKSEIISLMCPAVDDEVINFFFPDSSRFYGSNAPTTQLDILDILYGGALYDEALKAHVKQSKLTRGFNKN